MSQSKRQSKPPPPSRLFNLLPLFQAEYAKPSQSVINKAQFEKRTSLSGSRKMSQERDSPANQPGFLSSLGHRAQFSLGLDTSAEKIRQFLEEHSLTNQSDVSKELIKETESTQADHQMKDRVLTEQTDALKFDSKLDSNLFTPDKRTSYQTDDQFISPEKEFSSEPKPSQMTVLPSNKEKLEKPSPLREEFVTESSTSPNKRAITEQQEEEDEEEEEREAVQQTKTPQKADAYSGRALKPQTQNIEAQKGPKKPEEKPSSNQKPKAADPLSEAANQLRKAADRLTIKSFLV